MSNVQEGKALVLRLERRRRKEAQESPQQQQQSPTPREAHAAAGSRKKSPRLGDVAAICAAWSEAHKKSGPDNTVARELRTLVGRLDPQHLTPLHFSAMIARWKQRYRPYTTHTYRQALMRLVRHIAILAGRPDLPHQVPKVRPGHPRRTIATPPEIDKLLQTAQRWMKAAILLAAHGGLRRTDITRVAPEHYNAEARTITIQQHKTDTELIIPVSETLASLLDSIHDAPPTKPFLEILHERPVSPTNLTQAWEALRKKAGVNPELTLHDLRRTLAVSLYEISKDLRIVEQMLGHQSLGATVHYLEHRDPAKLRPYVDALYTQKGKQVIQ